MKRFLICVFAIMTLAVCPGAKGQLPVSQNSTVANPAASGKDPMPFGEPEWAGTVYLVADGKLISTEKKAVEVQSKVKGFSGGIYYLAFSGKKSTTDVSPIPVFAVKLEGLQGDPSDIVHCNSLTVDEKSGNRTIIVGSQSLTGSSKKVEDMSVQLVFTKYGTNSVKFSPASPLRPGNYMVTVGSIDSTSLLAKRGAEVGCLFSVD